MQTLKQKHRHFCFSVKGQVKMLRLALTVTSMAFFVIAQAPEPYIVITGFEVAVIFFFIILYMLRLDRLIDCLFWPLLDIINSMVTAIFMIIISVLALIPETTTFIVLGGSLCLTAAIGNRIFDGTLVAKLVRNTVKSVLGIELESLPARETHCTGTSKSTRAGTGTGTSTCGHASQTTPASAGACQTTPARTVAGTRLQAPILPGILGHPRRAPFKTKAEPSKGAPSRT
ncbi:chemokine-like factor isoform X3 [Prionailurus viverrinus]|uniref:chemokine-like factor isoform X3 n=1 Tax=Prionailurus viverrinus TaxID=61388 RepID=UPI001FF21B5F|nr:chemokine-like factor isoform X3 [Prionailurus viverrinus]